VRAADLTTAAILIAGGLLVLFDSLRLGVGWGTDGPKSGFFPFWLSVITIGACLGIAVQAWRRADRRPFVPHGALRPVLTVLLPATAFVVLVQLIGLYVATALYMGTYMRWIGRYAWPVVILIAIGFPLVTFLVFEVWFLVPMPKGPVEAWLGY